MSKKPKKRKHRRPSKQARRDKTPKAEEVPVYRTLESYEKSEQERYGRILDIKTSLKKRDNSLQASLYQSTTGLTAPEHELYRLLDEKGLPLLPREKDEP